MKDFNFFKPYLGQKKQSKNKMIYIITTLGLFTTLVLGTFLWNSLSIFKLEKDIDKLKSQYNSKENQDKLQQMHKLEKKYEVLIKYYDGVKVVYASVEDNSKVDSNFLNKITSTIPGDISFKTINVDGANLQIQGISKSRKAIGEFQHNLKKLNFVSEVHISNIGGEGTDSTGEYNFNLKCLLKGVNKDE